MEGLARDRAIRSVVWQDLRHLSTFGKIHELLLSAPWLAGGIVAFETGWIVAGLACSFFFFLTGLRQAHGAQHYTIGIGKLPQDVLMLTLGTLMACSLHALQATHMHHHRHCLDDSDVEASTARRAWYWAILGGPAFIVRLHLAGYRLAKPAKRRWIVAEMTLVAAWIAGVAVFGSDGLRWFVAAMVCGECLTGFFAVWTVHHDCDAVQDVGRTQRGRWKNRLSYAMFFHVEHHLFPAVPTARLAELAERIDACTPRLTRKQVF